MDFNTLPIDRQFNVRELVNDTSKDVEICNIYGIITRIKKCPFRNCGDFVFIVAGLYTRTPCVILPLPIQHDVCDFFKDFHGVWNHSMQFGALIVIKNGKVEYTKSVEWKLNSYKK